MNKIIIKDLNEIISSEIINWQKFQDATVLVTGANGMLPAYMVFTLLHLNSLFNYNVKVIALVRNKEKANKKFNNFLTDSHLKIIVQDVNFPINIDEPIDYIIHAASQASPKYYGIDPVGTINANILGTINVLKLADEKKTKSILYFSSGEVYGASSDTTEQLKSTESNYGLIDPLNVRSCYGQSKRMGENLCVSWNFQYKTNARIVRPFHSYGPGMLLNDGRVFADFISNIIHNENIILHSDGSAQRAFCYITDATIAFFKVLLDGENGNAYNVGNPDCNVSILELANILTSLYPEKNIKVETKIIENDMRTMKMKSPLSVSIPDITKINKLGCFPHISIKEGFKRTIDSFL